MRLYCVAEVRFVSRLVVRPPHLKGLERLALWRCRFDQDDIRVDANPPIIGIPSAGDIAADGHVSVPVAIPEYELEQLDDQVVKQGFRRIFEVHEPALIHILWTLPKMDVRCARHRYNPTLQRYSTSEDANVIPTRSRS